jgi:hypothetical protein
MICVAQKSYDYTVSTFDVLCPVKPCTYFEVMMHLPVVKRSLMLPQACSDTEVRQDGDENGEALDFVIMVFKKPGHFRHTNPTPNTTSSNSYLLYFCRRIDMRTIAIRALVTGRTIETIVLIGP